MRAIRSDEFFSVALDMNLSMYELKYQVVLRCHPLTDAFYHVLKVSPESSRDIVQRDSSDMSTLGAQSGRGGGRGDGGYRGGRGSFVRGIGGGQNSGVGDNSNFRNQSLGLHIIIVERKSTHNKLGGSFMANHRAMLTQLAQNLLIIPQQCQLILRGRLSQ